MFLPLARPVVFLTDRWVYLPTSDGPLKLEGDLARAAPHSLHGVLVNRDCVTFACMRSALTAMVVAIIVSGGADNATAANLTWGVNGAGGSGTWNTTTANWFNGSQNVTWPSGGDAVFPGASGGTVT